LCGDVGRNRWPAVVDDERRLVEGELRDASAPPRCLEGERSPGGDAPDVRCSPGLADHRLEIFDLPLDGVPSCR
jgi:hypothetical protein